jgi:signal transduction histidine kinase
MAGVRDLLSIDRAERRRAQLFGAGTIALVAAADLLAYGPSPARLLTWAALVLAFLGAAALMTHGPAWIGHASSMATLLSTLLAMVFLAGLGGGTTSPYFLMLPAIPLLVVTVVPEDTLVSALGGLVVLTGGLWLLGRAGRPAADLVTWGLLVLVLVFFALGASLRQRARRERSVEAELQRVRALDQLAESERVRLMAERWAAVGLLADGVAHDVNSPLGSLRSNLAFAREELAAGRTGELDAALLDAQEGVERIREIVASLRAFSLSETEAQERRALAERATPTPAPLPSRLGPTAGPAAARRPR